LNREDNNNRSNDRRQDRDQRDQSDQRDQRDQRDQGDQRDQRDQRNRERNPMTRPGPGMGMPPNMAPPNFPPPGQGMGMPPNMGPPNLPPPGAGMDGMPRTAPPNFVPEAPRMERSPMGGVYYVNPSQQRGGSNRPIRRCVNSFTYIWLRNGSNFWFYITRVDDIFIQGFRWRGNRWEFDRISRNRIIFYRCF